MSGVVLLNDRRSPAGLTGCGELVVVNAFVEYPEAGQRGDGRVDHGWRPADIGVRALEIRLVLRYHIGDHPDLAVPFVLFGGLGQRRDITALRQRALQCPPLPVDTQVPPPADP